jgi:peptidoglycan-N-acetylglucosamine deacetylase
VRRRVGKRTGRLAATATLVALVVAGWGGDRPDRRVALTFDDLPVTGGDACDTVAVRDVTRRLTGVLQARSLPAAGLATPGRPCLTPELLTETLGRWLAVGAILGNHTATHPDINTTPVDAYLDDIDRAQELIDAAVSTDERWFRPPLLHSGDDAQKKRALDDHLAERGYRVAPVTVDNQEWVYAAVYARARRTGDDGLARRVAGAYVEHIEASMAYYEALSGAVFEREIPQVLLLHANLLNADHLDRVVAMLSGRGYRFVGLAEALADPAYARPDTYVGPRGLSWLQRWALEDGITVPAEPREAAWVAEAFRASR